MTRRAVSAALVLLLLALIAPDSAGAHPLGNFTINHLDIVRVSRDRVDVRWVLDQAEIPTFQERGRSPATVLAAKGAEALRGLRLSVDGRDVPLRASRGPGSISFPVGQGGLHTTRVELLLTAPARNAARVILRDDTFPGRLGWRAMVVAPGDGTQTRSSLPASEPTQRLRRYPTALLKSPADQRVITLDIRRGDGSVMAPRAQGGGLATTRDRSQDGFTGLFDDAVAGKSALIVLLLASFGWGALHALSPGHGKSMVAAYLVGARGTARHAVVLGATVTITHTIGVFALGVVTLVLSQYVLPEDLYPWLNLVAGLLVVLVGASVLRARVRGIPKGHHHGDAGHAHAHAHIHPTEHEEAFAHASRGENGAHAHAHWHTHTPGRGHGAHEHSHALESPSPRALIAAGASAGLIPCPSALVVLLGAIAQHQIALGLLLIVLFSLGLATTLTALGLAVVSARGLTSRWKPTGRAAALAAAAPAISALVIVGVGLLLTARAVPGII